MNTIHPDTLPFLRELATNNNREWFNAHKPHWLEIKESFEAFTQALIEEMEKEDDTLAGLTAKNSVYRIYRDTRFSADKTPYKTHVACFLSSWGPKNSGVPGYYFQLGCDEAYGLKGTCNLGGGIFMPTPEGLNAIRQEIFYCPDEFLAIRADPDYKKYFCTEFFTMKKLSRVPKGYPADWEYADLLKYKDYCTSHTMPDRMLGSPRLFDEVLRVWRASLPLNRFIQRALEETRNL
ncbi:MAG: DUF2461 domain-containing protein [Bacteroidales bacterium]|nr:DUF2461 domain-containing protein [Bacteroidales bacterium]